jgi:hypothetical protein
MLKNTRTSSDLSQVKCGVVVAPLVLDGALVIAAVRLVGLLKGVDEKGLNVKADVPGAGLPVGIFANQNNHCTVFLPRF